MWVAVKMERSEQNLNELETELVVVFASGMDMWSEGRREDSQVLSFSSAVDTRVSSRDRED